MKRPLTPAFVAALLACSLTSCRTESPAPGSSAESAKSPGASVAAAPDSPDAALKSHQEFFEQEARANPEDPNSYFNLGNIYFMQKKYAEAAEQYRRALAKIPEDKAYEADLLRRLGDTHAALKQTDEAVAAYQKAIAANPDDAVARRRLADLYEQTGRAAEAVRERTEAQRLQPNETGKQLVVEGKVREGLAELQKVEKKNAETHYLIGMSYFKLEQYGEAAGAFRRAVGLDPKYADAHFNLGNAYDRLNRHADAAESFKEVVRLTPDASDAHFNLGNAYAKLDRYPEAAAAYEQVIRINPDDADARLQLAILHLKHGNAEAATKQHTELKRINPDAAKRLEQLLQPVK